MIAKMKITPSSSVDSNGTPTFRDSDAITVDFNPQQLVVTGQTHWSYTQPAGQSGRTLQSTQGSSSTTVDFTLIFDTSEPPSSGGGTPQFSSVREKSDKLAKLIGSMPAQGGGGHPAGTPPNAGGPQPPKICRIIWGQNLVFIGVLTTLTQTFTYFAPDGTPLRVKLHCIFTEWPRSRPAVGAGTPDEPPAARDPRIQQQAAQQQQQRSATPPTSSGTTAGRPGGAGGGQPSPGVP